MKTLKMFAVVVGLVIVATGCASPAYMARPHTVLDNCKMTANCTIWPAPNNTIAIVNQTQSNVDVLDWEAKLLDTLRPGETMRYLCNNSFNSKVLYMTAVVWEVRAGKRMKVGNDVICGTKLCFNGDTYHTYVIRNNRGQFLAEVTSRGSGSYAQTHCESHSYPNTDMGGYYAQGEWHPNEPYQYRSR